MASLGRLEPVSLRNVWGSEAGDFTPWLAREENLAILGDAIGIELELEAQERNVGPFKADLLCKDTAAGHWVLIENQLERTDHLHLGQLLTYAAGLKAVTIVWIADRYTEEHRAALDWLNEITDERFNFFGLEVELWRIGSSPAAPKFNVVCKPNDWTRIVKREASRMEEQTLTDRTRLQLAFWTGFREFVNQRPTRIKPTKPLPQHWMTIALGRTGFNLAAVASLYDSALGSYSGHELRAEVVIDGPDSKAHYAQLAAPRAEIEREVGEPLIWHNPEDKRVCRIYLRRSADINDRERWDEWHEWLLAKLEILHRVLGHRVKRLEAAASPLCEPASGEHS